LLSIRVSQISKSLKAYIIIIFKTHKISRDKPILIKLEEFILVLGHIYLLAIPIISHHDLLLPELVKSSLKIYMLVIFKAYRISQSKLILIKLEEFILVLGHIYLLARNYC